VVLVQGVGIYRASDGKELLGNIGLPGYEASHPLVSGDLIIRKGKPDAGGKCRVGSRLKALSPDQVLLEEVWRHESKTNDISDVLFDGQVYSPHSGVHFSAATGKEEPMSAAGGGYPSPVLGGRYSQTAWWSFTAKGREMLNTIEKERGDGKRRT
jgi:hypothetical protein